MRSTLYAALICGCISRAAAGAEPMVIDPELRLAIHSAAAATSSIDDKSLADRWLTEMALKIDRHAPKSLRDVEERLAFLRILHAEATRAGVSPELALAVIDVESRFQRFAISPVGALGYMQVMPFWIEEIGQDGDNLFHTKTNLRMGCTILKFYLEKENGNYVRALARYNGSAGKPEYPFMVLDRLTSKWSRSERELQADEMWKSVPVSRAR